MTQNGDDSLVVFGIFCYDANWMSVKRGVFCDSFEHQPQIYGDSRCSHFLVWRLSLSYIITDHKLHELIHLRVSIKFLVITRVTICWIRNSLSCLWHHELLSHLYSHSANFHWTVKRGVSSKSYFYGQICITKLETLFYADQAEISLRSVSNGLIN